MHVVILIKILHPQRSGLGNVVEETGAAITEKIEEIISSVQTADKDNTFTLPAATMDELEEKIRHALTVQKLFTLILTLNCQTSPMRWRATVNMYLW